MISSSCQAQKLRMEDMMKQLDFGFAARSKSKPPIPFGVAVEDTLKARMAEMIIAVFKKGGVRKDDTSGTE